MHIVIFIHKILLRKLRSLESRISYLYKETIGPAIHTLNSRHQSFLKRRSHVYLLINFLYMSTSVHHYMCNFSKLMKLSAKWTGAAVKPGSLPLRPPRHFVENYIC